MKQDKAFRIRIFEDYDEPLTSYERILARLEKTKHTAADVERFSIALAEFQEEEEFSAKAGIFLSALMNSGKDQDYAIHTAHLHMTPDFIGYQNTKNITVDGDVGDTAGAWMTGGSITITGNAGITLGLGMRAGSITVNGDADYHIGRSMVGGEIRIEGGIGKIAAVQGKIFHKGKLIVDK